MFLFLLELIGFISSNIFDTDSIYHKQYPNIGRVGYYAEYLGTVKRTIPEVKTENICPIDHIPLYGGHVERDETYQRKLLKESFNTRTTYNDNHLGIYDILDKDGYLYKNGEHIYEQINCHEIEVVVGNGAQIEIQCENGPNYKKLYKHYGAYNLYRGNISDSEPAIIKRITINPRNFGFHLTGVYAPPGEIISIRISEKDLEAVGILTVAIGQVLNDGAPNNIWIPREFNRMPYIGCDFYLTKDSNPHERDGTDYIFYIGTFLGGPVYVRPDKKPFSFTVTISGAVKYPHFIKGYTSKEEFKFNMDTTTPYIDIEVWQHGVLHSGPRVLAQISDYDQFQESTVYWEKMTGVSHQFPGANDRTCTINMMYETFVAAGAAVAFPTRGTTNCPDDWLKFVVDYPKYIVKASGDIWGPHHEYNHHFQDNWGLKNDGECSNNAVTLTAYSFYTRISERRTEEREPDGDGWNQYTSASYCVREACNQGPHDYELNIHGTVLHCLGQYIFIKATQLRKGRNTDKWHQSLMEATELNFTYFLRDIYHLDTLSEEQAIKTADRTYKAFVPVACKYQTGIGYMIKGKRNVVHTMRPFCIQFNKATLLNFTKQIVVPMDIQYQIKSITQPPHGRLEKQSEGIYLYHPDPNEVYSGEITLTLSLQKIDDPYFLIDDIEIYIEFLQTYELRDKYTSGTFNGQRKLDTKIYWYPDGEAPIDPVAAFQSNYAGSVGSVDIISNGTIGDANTDIWFNREQFLPNRISEMRGKFQVQAKSYRLAIRGRHHCAVFVSLDNGKTYELAAQIQDYNDDQFHLDNDQTYHDYKFDKPQWVYFKEVLIHEDRNGKICYIGLGLGEINSDGQCTINKLNAYEDIYQLDNFEFVNEDVFPRVTTESFVNRSPKGKLLEYQYSPYTGDAGRDYSIENLFDDDDDNEIHTCGNCISESRPFYVLVDLGKEILANKMTLHYLSHMHQYYAKTFTLRVGNDPHDLRLIADVEESVPVNNQVTAIFEPTKFRYYELNITASHRDQNFLCYRYLDFSYQFDGELVSLDDKRVTLYNQWEKKNGICTFGMLYVGQKDSKAVFKFNGTKIGIQAYSSPEYGRFRVIVDGIKLQVVDLNKPQNQLSIVYRNITLSNTEHTIVIQGIDKFNIDSLVFGPDLTSYDETRDETFLDYETDEPIEQDSSSPIYSAYSDVIQLTPDGLIDGTIKQIFKDDSLIYIKTYSNQLNIQLPNQDMKSNRYLQVQNDNTVITISPSENTNNQIGIHPNSKKTTVQLPSNKVLLNIYNNEDNSLKLVNQQSQVIQIGVIDSVSGNLTMNSNSAITVTQINCFNNGTIQTFSDSKPIDITTSKVNMNANSVTTISHLNIVDNLNALSRSKLIAVQKIAFGKESTCNLSLSSFIDLNDATVEGVVKSLFVDTKVLSAQSVDTVEHQLICGSKFDCAQWKHVYHSDSGYHSKCEQNEKGETCLIVSDSPEDNKSKSTVVIIAVVVSVVVVVIIIIIVIVIVIKKKRVGTVNSDIDLNDERETVTNLDDDVQLVF